MKKSKEFKEKKAVFIIALVAFVVSLIVSVFVFRREVEALFMALIGVGIFGIGFGLSLFDLISFIINDKKQTNEELKKLRKTVAEQDRQILALRSLMER